MSKLLNIEDIYNAKDIDIEKVDVPEWDGYVYIKSLSGSERDAYEGMLFVEKFVQGKKTFQQDLTNARAKLLVMCVCNDNGELIFNKSQVEKLGQKSAAALNRLFTIAQRKSGLTEEDLKEALKNLETDPNEDSISN